METPLAKAQTSKLSSSRVRVVLRIRPFLPFEKDGRSPVSCISVLEESGEEVTVHIKDQWTSRNEVYKLDSIFDQEDSISQIFHKEVSSVIPGVFHGLNATVFAYGATGSGKTYTMQGTENKPGLIPLAMTAILSLSGAMQSLVDFSFYEVYMDRCYDLLEPKSKEIMVLDDKNGKVQLRGLSWVPVSSFEEFTEMYLVGVQRRKVAHTELNDVSSRSHAVLSIAVRHGDVMAKLNLIDLAGNEDNKRSCNEAVRLQESAKINQSLFALSNVIYALNNNEPRIPYRESKLTRILQDSLGGESRALMIACLNPGSYQEAVHTVSLAARSRHIVNYAGSTHRRGIQKETVDMEAKLRAWLDSKGKTKDIQRLNGHCFSPSCQAPTSLNYFKKLSSTCSSMKLKNPKSISFSNKGRKLFDFEAGVSTSICVEAKNENVEHEVSNEGSVENTIIFTGSLGSHRRVLSPLKPSNYQISSDSTSFSMLDPKTPKTPFFLASGKNKFEFSTPVEKFKESLVEEYISFLNVASKEELMKLKGIGQKRAECILELRKDYSRPIKSLADLEMMGLSSKQVQCLLKSCAKGVFT